MKGLGKGVREFKDSMNDVKRDLEDTGREANKKIEDAQK
jgi:Sec-independent protein translocase protein TatA